MVIIPGSGGKQEDNHSSSSTSSSSSSSHFYYTLNNQTRNHHKGGGSSGSGGYPSTPPTPRAVVVGTGTVLQSANYNNNHNNSYNNNGISSKTSTTPSKTYRPRPPALWTVNECKAWFARHCGDLGVKYSELLHKNNVNGRSLLKMNSEALERMGILDPAHRKEINREIVKLKLKSDVLEIRDLESQVVSHRK